MRLRLFLAFIACTLLFFGCSRESSIKENVNLRNNHSVVFAFRTPFEDPDAFADSIANLANPDSVIAHDTLTVTINDTVYLMGFLKYNADKIYRYAWLFTNPNDTVVTENKTPLKWVFKKTTGDTINCPEANSTLYCPLFLAVDGNNAKDTAGRDQFIRVIDTPPYLTVPRDTLWTRAKSDITFPIVALDSFGTIKSIKVDLDASGKEKPKEWKTKEVKGTDTLLLTIEYNKKYIDSLGNQKIYVIVTDDDKNETIDSVNLHFNQLPKIELLDPKDDGRYSTDERFAFFYKASDVDNPASLRYFIRVAKSRDNYGTPPVLTDNDLIAKNIKEKSYEPRASKLNDSNVIVTLKNPKSILSGRLYWEVWVTDGYDTVVSSRIKEKDGTTRPWKFFLGDLKRTTGNFLGTIKYEGWSHHEGIRIEFLDSLGNHFFTNTSDDGRFSISVEAGKYSMRAMDTTGYGFKDTIVKDLNIDISEDFDIGTHILKDTANPVIVFSDMPDDTISVSSLVLNGKFYDHGSQVKTATAILDEDTLKFSSLSQNTWVVDLKDMEDGKHKFSIFAKDSAGRKSDSTISFIVKSTSIHIAVNGNMASMQENDKPFVFTAEVSKTSIADSLIWVSNVPNFKEKRHKLKDFKDTVKYSKASDIGTLEDGKYYEMYAMTPSGVKSNVVRFGVLGNDPLIYFQKPSNDTTISLNDTITFSIFLYPGKDGSGDATITQQGEGSNRNFSSGTIKSEADEKIHWNKAGTKKIIVTYTNGKTVSDTLRVNVIEDPPTIKILNKQNNTNKKVNSTEKIEVKAYDKFGTIKEINWTCSNNPVTFDNHVAITEKDTVSANIEFIMPGTTTHNYKCIVQAIDDDDVAGYDTITYNVRQSEPYLTLNTQNATVKINSSVSLSGTEQNLFDDGSIDTEAKITDRMFYCDSIKKNLGSAKNEDWTHISKLDTSINVPNTSCTWYCLVKIVNNENLSASDTSTYTVVLDPPWVNVSEPNLSVTIKDTITLDARSGDNLGKIVKYEWGCGTDANSITYTYSSKSTPRYNAVMPNAASNDYKCIVRVTDDDGLTATDTTHIDVALAPPTIQVIPEKTTTRPGFKINLDADANDAINYDGEIVKREWSCGESDEISSKWKKVSSFDTSWKAPQSTPTKPYYCVARATDDDGNVAMDTMIVNFTTTIPTLFVKNELMYVNLGESFALDAYINDAWQGVNWFNWECKGPKGKTLETTKKWTYDGSFFDIRDDQTSYIKDPTKLNGIDTLYCIISAEESSSDSIFRDTTLVKIFRKSATGKISAADTVYLWSGDLTVDSSARYFYSTEWGGKESTPGELGDPKKKYEYRWNFSSINSDFYIGNSDGSLSISSYEFNQAFTRPSAEGSMVITLDFRDSIAGEYATQEFLDKHKAPEASRTVYFRKAWKNLAKDTVIAQSKFTTAPALTTINSQPVIAYLSAKNKVASSYLKGSTWTSLDASTANASDSIIAIQLESNETDLYMATLTESKVLSVFKSTNGTSAWSKLGNTFNSDTSFKLLASTSGPIVVFLDTVNKTPYYATYSNNKWTSKVISTKHCRNITAAMSGSNNWIAAYIQDSSTYPAYYAVNNNGTIKANYSIADSINNISLAIDGNSAYLSFLSRKVEAYGPYVYKGTISTDKISWTKNSAPYNAPIIDRLAVNLKLATKDGKTYAIFDDGKIATAQSHVYQLKNSKWTLFGENELPYFKIAFYTANGYYLRGSKPSITIAQNGDVYISMLAWENAGGSGKNYGPIVMKYVASNWTINTK